MRIPLPRAPRLLAALLACAALPAAPAAAQIAPGATPADSMEVRLRAAADDGFSGQVLVVSRGEVVLHRGYGMADPEAGVPVDTATVFAVGSVTKRFTRAAVLTLAEEGVLSLDDPLSRWLDGLPADKADIPLRLLLDMRAGLPEYHDDAGDHQAMSREEAIRRIGAAPLRFEPGSDRAYSNSGYVLLAAVVEEASGMPYEAYLRRALFEPAGMEATGFHGEERWPDARVARGHGARVHGDNAPHRWPYTWALKGAGGMVASASDLRAFVEATRAGRALGPETRAALYPDDRPDLVYAGGDDYGFVTLVMELDHGEHLVVVSTNSGFAVDPLARELAGILGWTPPAGAAVREREGGEAPGAAPDEPAPAGVPDSPRARGAGWLLSALSEGTDGALRELVESRFAPAMRDAFTMDEHLAALTSLAERVERAGVEGLRPVAPYEAAVLLGDGGRIVVEVEADAPHLVTGVRLEEGG